MELADPKDIYADILIALANADDIVDPREREMLDGIFTQMGLGEETVAKLWLTPRTLDVAEALLKDITDARFKRCLLKDCYLLAYADEDIEPGESKFIKAMQGASGLDDDVVDAIGEWVETAVAQQRKAAELFE